jgi:hypothetical protein
VGALLVTSLQQHAAAAKPADSVLAMAEQLFGPSLNAEHHIFQLNDAYVLWLIFEPDDSLSEVDVGPKSYYTSEFPATKKPGEPEYLSAPEYEDALQKVSQLKDIGALQEPHGRAGLTNFGLVNTDRFDQAFVDRIVGQNNNDKVTKFNIYFLRDSEGSPEQVTISEAQAMVCLVGLWYYLPPEQAKTIELGKWRMLRVAGPNLHGQGGCYRTTPVYDADGFTIENPQNETIVLSDITVRALAGQVRVAYAGDPVEGVNVEVLLVGGKKVLRRKTDHEGVFAFSGLPDGKYKFKVTKDGFKALSGFIVLDHQGQKRSLVFELHVGT